ncbi:MAG: transglycosylase domain-containing protein [Clostridia bacterium]
MAKKKKQRNKFLSGLFMTLKVLCVLFLVLITIAGGVIFGSLVGYIDNIELLDLKQMSVNLTSFVYAVDEYGTEHQLEVLYDEENRVWADLEEIPDHLKNAFVAIEDERFYTHKGFDIKRTVGAAIGYIQQKITGSSESTYGGSTITQQLIKNITGEDDYSIDRKIQEIYRAYKLEQEIDKDEILELYLNTIYLSQQCNGVKSASKVYFNKELSELTLSECATIAAITQFPTKYDPKRNPENNRQRRDVILNKMYELGYITYPEYAEAKATEVVTVAKEESTGYSSTTSYYTDALIDQIVNDLVEQKGYTKAIAEKLLYCGGFKIYSAMNTNVQSIMDAYYANLDNFPKTSGDTIVQSSMVVIDPTTGYVAGVVGGRGVKEASRTLNRATQTLRQPGSSIKPIAIYAPAVEYGLVTPQTIVSDTPVTIGDWSPRNDDRSFRGNITVASALAGSRNVPAVKILQRVGLERSFSFLTKNMHISSLVESREENGKVFSDKGFASIGLGGLTDGVSVLEMAAAYVPFASKGSYYEPSFYTKVLDPSGEVILERTPKAQPAISETTAVTMTQMLQGVVTSGTGTSARLSSMPSAGKTGTTSNNYDRWFVGYTPYYVGAVWYGYDTPKSLRGISGNPSAKVWKGVMEQIHSNLPYKDFNTLGATSKVLLCAQSGLLPNSTCESLAHGDYSESARPTTRCTIHKEIDMGEDNLRNYYEPTENVNSYPDTIYTPNDVPIYDSTQNNSNVTPPDNSDILQTLPNSPQLSDTGL